MATRCFQIGLVAAGHLGATPVSASAQELETKITSEISFLAALGDLGKRDIDADNELFEVDATLTIEAVYQTDDPYLRWGAITELTGDKNSPPGAEKAFLFLRSKYGDPRFGLDDSASVVINYMAPFVAVGTGGLDGDIIDSPELVFLTATDTSNTRIIYYSPFVRNWQFAGSYTPNDDEDGDDRDNDQAFDELVDATLNYYTEHEDFEVGAALSIAVADNYRGVSLSGTVGTDPLAIAGGIATEEIEDTHRIFYNLGGRAEIDPLEASLNWGQCVDCDRGESWNLIGGLEFALLPGVDAALEVSRFRDEEGHDGTIALFSLGFEL